MTTASVFLPSLLGNVNTFVIIYGSCKCLVQNKHVNMIHVYRLLQSLRYAAIVLSLLFFTGKI